MNKLQIFSLFMLICLMLIIIAYIIAFLYFNRRKKNNNENQTSADYINVKDIKDNEIYTIDGKAISIYRITPINTHLMTKAEMSDYISLQSGYLSTIKVPYKLLSIPRPFDVQPYISKLESQKASATDLQRQLINEEITALNNIAKSGTIIEKNYYLVYWDTPEDIKKSRTDFIKAWTDSNVQTSLLNCKELIELCNLVFNPSYTTQDNAELTFAVLEE